MALRRDWMSSACKVGRNLVVLFTVWKELERKSKLSSPSVRQSWRARMAVAERVERRWRYLSTRFKNLRACDSDFFTEKRP
ncbi:hypothetical protein SESBI_20332 [Sesbania bispinosa]|nr:hypothetical protein SESBI_20332 [Sesbania bispinosa]